MAFLFVGFESGQIRASADSLVGANSFGKSASDARDAWAVTPIANEFAPTGEGVKMDIVGVAEKSTAQKNAPNQSGRLRFYLQLAACSL